ncbi:hypothetical protein [Kiloniella majae]|uniref:hypothetical protein n=1 Tax=Kiloniella majae TaxID=1938558 RepID=UPI000A27940B|nr:hypothetical protein [Kiloniella majae]
MKSQYELYICDITGAHEPVALFISNTPFPNQQVGQRFDDHGWDRLRGVGKIASEQEPKRYTVHSIKTTLLTQKNINIFQTWLNLSPFHGKRSPVFGDTPPTMSSEEAKQK